MSGSLVQTPGVASTHACCSWHTDPLRSDGAAGLPAPPDLCPHAWVLGQPDLQLHPKGHQFLLPARETQVSDVPEGLQFSLWVTVFSCFPLLKKCVYY